MVTMDQVSHVQLNGFVMDCSRQVAITAEDGTCACVLPT